MAHNDKPCTIPAGAETAIAVQGVNYRYAGQDEWALREIDLSVAAGSCFGLLGPNGAGKTTLISLLTGIRAPQHGRIEIAGLSMQRSAAEIKQRSALVPQEYAFYPTLTGRENLQFFSGLYRIPSSERDLRIEESAEICRLTDVLDQRAASYSGGVKRRLNLAIGLLCRPEILYLDEPTVGIDAQSRHFILKGIEHLKAGGMTIVYTSHYMEEVEQVCDSVAIIDRGQVVLQQPIDVLLSGGKRMYIQPREVPSTGLLAELPVTIAGAWDGQYFAVDSHPQALSGLLAELESRGIDIVDIHLGRHRLEQVYLSVTDRTLRE